MRKLWIVTKNELMRYFISPLAYIYLVSFLILNAVTAFYFGHIFERGQASLFYMFCFLPWLYLLFLPGISMRLWAEEFRSKSIVQIITMPVSIPVLVWGKFLASALFAALALALTFPFVITVHILGNPDNMLIVLSYGASFVLACTMLSISQTMSALTKNQVIALVLAVIANLVFFFSGLEFVLSFFRIFLPDYMIDTIASFSFLTHFNSLINGVLEWRDVLFFASIIILFNFTTMLIVSFRTSGSSFWLKSGRRSTYVAAWIMLIVGFMGFNLLANNLTRGTELDFTQEKLWTLNQNTIDVLEQINEPITTKLYFSNILAKRNPNLRQVFDRVKMLLEHYKNASRGKFDFHVYHPQNLDNIEDRAIADGLQPIPLIDINQNALFGLSIVDTLDRKEVIPYLSYERLSSLEQDLTTLIYRLSHKKKTVGIISSISISGTSDNENMMFQPWEITNKISELYELKFINTPDDFEKAPDVLLIIHPLDLSDQMVDEIKKYSQNRGKILLFLDAAAEARRLYMASNSPYAVSDLNGLDAFWGFKFYGDYVVADLENSITVDATSNYKNNPAYTQDVIQFKLTPHNFNPFHPITQNLKSLLMSSASVLMPAEDANVSFLPLMISSDNSALMPVSVVHNGLNPRQILSFYQKDENVKILSAYIRGQDKNNPFELVVVTDTDLLYNDFWGTAHRFLDDTYFVPLFNNADFVLNALDYLTSDDALLKLRGKGLKNRAFENIENLRKQSIFEYKLKEEEIFERIDLTKRQLQEIWDKRDFEDRQTFTADELSLISQARRRLNDLRRELSQTRLLTSSKIERIALLVKLLNIFLIPLLLTLILIVYVFIKSPSKEKQKTHFTLNKPLLRITLIALCILLLGIISVFVQNRSDIQKYEDKPLLPHLKQEINEVQKIVLRNKETSLTFSLKDGLWVLENKPDFAVYQERIRSFLSALLEGVLYEKKSDKAENLAQFGLLPVEADGSTSTRIELKGEDNKIIEALEVGKYDIELGRGSSAAYVKFDDKFQVFKAEIEFVDLSLDWHEWTYSHLWDLRFGRFVSINGKDNNDLVSSYIKIFLNTEFQSAVSEIQNKKKLETFKITAENDLNATLEFYQSQNKYFVKYIFNGEDLNKHIRLFKENAEKYYFEIDQTDWENIKNVRNMAAIQS